MDIPTEIFYKVTGCKEGNPLPVGLSPVTHLNPANSRIHLGSTSRHPNLPVEEVATTAILPSVGRPYTHLGIKEVEEDTSSSTDAAIFDDPDDTEPELDSEARELGINVNDPGLPNTWAYDCLVDEVGVDITSLIDGVNMLLMQAQVNKQIRLEKIQLQGNRLFGFVSFSDDGVSTIWGSARSTATITELPPSPIKIPPQQSCSMKANRSIQPGFTIQERREHPQVSAFEPK